MAYIAGEAFLYGIAFLWLAALVNLRGTIFKFTPTTENELPKCASNHSVSFFWLPAMELFCCFQLNNFYYNRCALYFCRSGVCLPSFGFVTQWSMFSMLRTLALMLVSFTWANAKEKTLRARQQSLLVPNILVQLHMVHSFGRSLKCYAGVVMAETTMVLITFGKRWSKLWICSLWFTHPSTATDSGHPAKWLGSFVRLPTLNHSLTISLLDSSQCKLLNT